MKFSHPLHYTFAEIYDYWFQHPWSCEPIIFTMICFHCPRFISSSFRVYAILISLLVLHQAIPASSICERSFGPSTSEDTNKFVAPSRSNARPYKIININHETLTINFTGVQYDYKPIYCIYKFLGGEKERISLNFSSFNMRGDEPECSHEYVDIYIKLKPEEDLNSVIRTRVPDGRFCATVVPRRIVSLYNLLILVVYSDIRPINNLPMFTGTYGFMSTESNSKLVSLEPNSICAHTIYSSERREGEFQSVTYPGIYFKGLKCSYRLIGEPKQRVRLEFLDIDLYSGGAHCPFDSVKVFDGPDETDPILNTICGSHKSLIIYSTNENILVTFTTLQREAEVQNRGFSAYFEFSEQFVDTSFIKGPNVKHMRGSECDQRIISHKGSSGVIVSPDSRHHSEAICRYIFEGLQTSLDYERVMLKFIEFDLKTHRLQGAQKIPVNSSPARPPEITVLLNQPRQDLSPSNSNGTNIETPCPDNYVRLYTEELKADQRQDPNDYDYVFCGNDVPQTIESDAATLLMEYNSGSTGGYFKAEYTFIVDFRVTGLQSTSGCNYMYRSDHMKAGSLNSPRYPSWYMNDLECSYILSTKNDEALLLQFYAFKMYNTFGDKILGHNEACKDEDSVEISEVVFDQNYQRAKNKSVIGIYCGNASPGPILSFKSIMINFKTNKERVHYGFLAFYYFYSYAELKTNEFVTNCGGQIYSSQRLKTGMISSPETYRPETYEKRNHFCLWNITARPSHRIALDFNKFELEGSLVARGCLLAAVRIFLGRSKTPIEICGTLSLANESAHQYISETESLSLTFISTKPASGSNGFLATWTEVK